MKIRLSYNHLIFIMVIPKTRKDGLYIEMGPSSDKVTSNLIKQNWIVYQYVIQELIQQVIFYL